MNRRQFLSNTTAGVTGLMLTRGLAGETDRSRRPVISEKVQGALPARLGSYYVSEVPDMLDLAEHARLGINHFTESIRENLDYEMIMGVKFEADGSISAPMHMTGIACCQAKCMEAMAMERLMSGSQQHVEREGKMVD